MWIDCHDNENSVVSIVRYARDRRDFVVILLNFTAVPRPQYGIGVPHEGWYAELLNSDSEIFGGSKGGGIQSEPVAAHGFDHSLRLMVQPPGCLFLKRH